MLNTTIHNPDRYMADLRQILSQGRKRIGLLIGAGAPTAIRVDRDGRIVEDGGDPLVPDVVGLTKHVVSTLSEDDKKIIEILESEITGLINIETILTQVRKLAQAIGSACVHGLDANDYDELAQRICEKIGNCVNVTLPQNPNPYSEVASWISGTRRLHSIEIFTPNYDLLFEEALERNRAPYFDGFSGSYRPFFDAAGVSTDALPSRWTRLWKLHGSLGWTIAGDSVVRTGSREATQLIYPDHLKYDQVTRQPYSALFERLRSFLTSPDTLLLCSGFSFLDAHICAVLEEAMTANAHSAIFAFQYKPLSEEVSVTSLARSRPNLSVYARDGAVINGVPGRWEPGQSPSEDWEAIRHTFWNLDRGNKKGEFLLGDFAKLARFLALTQMHRLENPDAGADDESDAEHVSPVIQEA
ncbi:MAG: SIR2 family protein [Caldilineaceae bacterium SB0670_bin_27]|uniref:SIR2 family protein n=1 Tax=Caldilineaceae bacterium SB0664_bin_27 TaxID=2605260 RepID=A0A6B0YXQ5_9CHLR|nr:SIR2 family protein [Caldilineaceae bacterium SB0664_bin_27]MYJ78615.1 SIR2 family protein [Caldilineaceae bacterium SB0670_bin_27]